MASAKRNRIESSGAKFRQRVCRLCLSEESLEDIFSENELHQWILDLLSINVTGEDPLGHVICDVCQLRITEFHQFRTRCQEVQIVLQSMMRDQKVPSEKESTDSDEINRIVKTEPCEEIGHVTELEEVNHSGRIDGNDDGAHRISQKEMENEETIGIDDEIYIEEIKIESLMNDNEESVDSVIDESVIRKGKASTRSIQVTQKDENIQSVQCNMRNKKYQTKQNLSVHKRTAHGPKKHNCKVCAASFPHPKDLNRHEQTKQHIKKKSAVGDSLPNPTGNDKKNTKHPCSKCNRTFSRQCQLENHEKLHDVTSNEDQPLGAESKELEWQCNICSKSFADKEKLRLHKRHHKPKNLECHICGKPFLFSFSLNRHTKTHDVDHKRSRAYDESNAAGPFYCDICQKQFRLRTTMRWHRIQVHGPKCHECHMCDSKFSTRYGLRKHIQTHYRVKKKTRNKKCSNK